MNRETSLYLDAARFLAALAVFFSHISASHFTGGFLWQMKPYADIAVTIFFVLSGFVIAYAVDTRETSAGTYIVNRMARIYSVALPALVATFVLDAVGRSLRPELYVAGAYEGEHPFWRFLAGITFTNELWTSHLIEGSNGPYWSLGYEVWYYVIYGLAVFSPHRWRVLLVLGAIAVAGPAIMAMFPIWLLGVATYHLSKRWTLSPAWGVALFVAALSAWVAYQGEAWRNGYWSWFLPADPWLRRPQLLQDWVVGLCFAASILGFRSASKFLGTPLMPLARPIRFLAGATFTIYLFHRPVAQFLSTLQPWPPSDPKTRLVMILGTLAIMFAIARVTEKRKDAWRRAITALATVIRSIRASGFGRNRNSWQRSPAESPPESAPATGPDWR